MAPLSRRHIPNEMRARAREYFTRLQAWLLDQLKGPAQGYLLAPLGVAGATVVIGIVLSVGHLGNVSLLYLPIVLWLAARYGQGPAVLASALSFLSYDFYFIPPLHLLTVDQPIEWISLFALLATALVLGRLTALVRDRAREAEESQRRAETLFRLAQSIADSASEHDLHQALSRQVVEVFAPSGVRACALMLPDETGALQIVAFSSQGNQEGFDLGIARAKQTPAALMIDPPASRRGEQWRPAIPPSRPAQAPERPVLVRAPLKTARGVVGALLLSGAPSIKLLAPEQLPTPPEESLTSAESLAQRQEPLFATFCDQIALAMDRATLAREALHTAALRESDRLKDALLGSVTHELRTPLAAIKAATSGLLQANVEWSPQERIELLTSIDTSADRLNRLVSNLLDLSRLEAGVAEPEMDWRLMSDVIAATLDQLEISGQLRGRVISVDEPDDLPLVLLDQGQIQQVLTNLIENALKYSPEGSEIRIQVSVQDEWLQVAVSDQGIGIPSGEVAAIFNKFYRVQQARLPWSANRPPIGTGLGLAICAAIMAAHGGRIWAESVPGHGSTLTFTLPISGERPQGALPEIDIAPAEPTEPAEPGAPEQASEQVAPR